MVWFVLLAVGVVAVSSAMSFPLHAVRQARRMSLRSDGTESRNRAARERTHSVRLVMRAAVGPVLFVAVFGAILLAVEAFTPWSDVASLMGTTTPETATVSEGLVDQIREAELERERLDRLRREAETEGYRPAPAGSPVQRFLTTHWPLRPLGLLCLGLVVWLARRQSQRARDAYAEAMRARRRDYWMHDTMPPPVGR